jgi:formylglycine-generating enzyme required for sulfatase activity
MGEVWLAEDTALGRKVALKVLLPEAATHEEASRRLEREARLAASLDHPNVCTIHEVGHHEGAPFIVMQLVEGETLAERLARGPMAVRDAVAVAAQIAEALVEAEAKEIVHRDLKPQNVMLTATGRVKVMDFGLAAVRPKELRGDDATPTHLTMPGAILGTVPYMSPEQVRGEDVDGRSDLFSLGTILHEMTTGRRLFSGSSAAEVLAAILQLDPPAPSSLRPDAPLALDGIVDRALRKGREERYGSAREMLADLSALAEAMDARRGTTSGSVAGVEAGSALTPVEITALRGKRRLQLAAVALLVVTIAAAAGLEARRRSRQRWVDRAIPKVEALAGAGEWFEAYDLAVRILTVRPHQPVIERLMPEIADDLSVSSEPPGAGVFLQRMAAADGSFPPRESLGVTPVEHRHIARGDYVLAIEKSGFAPFERTISTSVARALPTGKPPSIDVVAQLQGASRAPKGMVFVPGGEYQLVGWGQPTQRSEHLDGFLLDQFEVTNRAYEEFVAAGGYRRRELWNVPFADGRRTLSWDEAIARFIDRTGLPGPRDWSGGTYPPGKERYPVTGVTWYEAAACAAFRGKSLPTVFEWEKAARDGVRTYMSNVMPWGLFDGRNYRLRSNFESEGAVRVDAFTFGMSPFGAYNMAGNVAEWAQNAASDGFLVMGGSWADPPYVFGDYGTRPGLFASDRLGFRCVRRLPGSTSNQGAKPIGRAESPPVYTRSSAADFRGWLTHFRYDPTPLRAQLVETSETDAWRLERVAYDGAAGQRVVGYLFLPRRGRPPYQAIHYIPGSGPFVGQPVPETLKHAGLEAQIAVGRAVFVASLEGYPDRSRPPEWQRPDQASVAYRELVVRQITDMRRGIDWLETRPDLDSTRLALVNVSLSLLGIDAAAVEPRYKAVALLSSGVYREQLRVIPEVSPILLAPHIRAPKLMLNGRHDEDFIFAMDAMPLFNLLVEPKRLETYDGGHLPPPEVVVPVLKRFLDENLGPVDHRSP